MRTHPYKRTQGAYFAFKLLPFQHFVKLEWRSTSKRFFVRQNRDDPLPCIIQIFWVLGTGILKRLTLRGLHTLPIPRLVLGFLFVTQKDEMASSGPLVSRHRNATFGW